MAALLVGFTSFTTRLTAQAAFKINGKTYTVEDLAKDHQGKFFEIEQKKYELISDLAREKYLEEFFQKLSEKDKVSVEKAREDYLASRTKVSDSEIKDALDKFKDYPQLKDRSDAEKKKLMVDYLQRTKAQDVFESILAEGISKKQLEIQYPEPKEPVYKLTVTDQDPVKYGPNPKDTKPFGCKGNDCPITIVEYSEFQCPFCERVQPAVRRLMGEYKGKIRWIVRDFPLGFHNRARPAAVAAHCAKDQNKFWEMYEELFKNQKSLEDADLRKAAQTIGLDLKKYDECFAKPAKKFEIIDENFRSGEKLGVTGTPAFFINGRRLSGALPYEEFKRVIDSELAKK
jgi:protein-disulfide isomerase